MFLCFVLKIERISLSLDFPPTFNFTLLSEELTKRQQGPCFHRDTLLVLKCSVVRDPPIFMCFYPSAVDQSCQSDQN